jgi:aldehyde dehydrogenase
LLKPFSANEIKKPFARVLIDGSAAERAGQDIHNPADPTDIVGSVALGTADDVNDAVEAASRALPAWAALSARQRGAMLTRAAAVIREGIHDESLIELLIREHGKVRWEANVDVMGAPMVLEYYASLADQFDEEELQETAIGTVSVRRRAIGVAGVIIPWNYPVYLGFLMLVPALLAGNPVVVKPSELAPLTVSRIVELLADQLPAGVVSLVQGPGRPVGEAIASHPGVRAFYFTGSTATGKAIALASIGNLKRLGLELGGNDPAIVLPGARMEPSMIDELARGAFTGSGQVCYSIKRLYVHEDQAHELYEKLAIRLDQMRLGVGDDPRSDLGPVSNKPQYEKVQRLISELVTAGADVSQHGQIETDLLARAGYFIRPTLVRGVSNEAAIVQEEQFGPVLPIVTYSDLSEAVDFANDTEYGLAASVWSDDVAAAATVAGKLEAGSVFINAHRLGASPLDIPFGGVKQSGIGRRHGFIALEESSELQAIVVVSQHSALPGPKN